MIKLPFILFLFLACAALCRADAFSSPLFFAYDDEQVFRNYIRENLPLARVHAAAHGIPVSICLAQALHESRAGGSTLATAANNHFGIKALDTARWHGERIFIKDDDRDADGNLKESPFRKYASTEESYADYARFLKENTRYASLFELPKTDYKGWALGLLEAGYATDSMYAVRLIEKIERYELQQFDAPEAPTAAAPETRKHRKMSDCQLLASYKPVQKTETAPGENRNRKDSEIAVGQQAPTIAEAPVHPTLLDFEHAAPPMVAPACPPPTQRLAPMRARLTFMPIELRTK